MVNEVLSIEQIKIDEKLYPRMKTNWITYYDYSESMKAGAKFPPILVAFYKRGYYLIDGRHRIEATKILKEKYIKAEVKKGLTAKEIFLLAIKSNIGHGRQFSPHEKAAIAIRLKDMNYKIGEISKLINIPLSSINKFVSNRMTNTISGKEVILKSPIKSLSGYPVDDNIELLQEKITTSSQIQALNQVIILLENNWIDFSNEMVIEKLTTLSQLVKKIKVVAK